jgi:cysteine desulfurase/selenocysteine lyase
MAAMNAPLAALRPNFDIESVRADFPILHQKVNGKPLAYLDSAGSAQRPRQVLDALMRVYENDYANVHRGVHTLSQRASEGYENARHRVRQFLNAPSDESIVFVRGATEALNLVAASYGPKFLKSGDEIIVTEMEHHSNIVPWQLLRDQFRRFGGELVLKMAPVLPDGQLDMAGLKSLIGPRTRILAVTHVSNVLGTINPIGEIARLAHEAGAVIVVDGCAAAPHMPVDVQALDVDFYAFSSHKLYGPGGVGVLYGRKSLLQKMPPYQGGGGMIQSVTLGQTDYADIPARFEAGTPAIADAIALTAALDYVEGLGWENIQAHEDDLCRYAMQKLGNIPGLTLVGTAPHKAPIVSFVTEAAHAHDIGTILDQQGVAIRTGNHCAEPLAERFDVASTARASFGLYNTRAEIDVLAAAVSDAVRMFTR